MREVKAYLRLEKVDELVRALRDNWVARMKITHVRSLGSGVDPRRQSVSFEAGTTYTETAKLEFVCSEPELEQLVPLIRAHALTGEKGDGIIFVSPVHYALKVRTGAEGREALR